MIDGVVVYDLIDPSTGPGGPHPPPHAVRICPGRLKRSRPGSIYVRNQSDELIGSGTTTGDLSSSELRCEVSFALDVPKATFYTIKIGSHDGPAYSFEEMTANGWSESLSLGDCSCRSAGELARAVLGRDRGSGVSRTPSHWVPDLGGAAAGTAVGVVGAVQLVLEGDRVVGVPADRDTAAGVGGVGADVAQLGADKEERLLVVAGGGVGGGAMNTLRVPPVHPSSGSAV
jgi:hypothetical protein